MRANRHERDGVLREVRGDVVTRASTMRQRFYEVAAELLDEDPRVAVVLAEIGAGELRAAPAAVQRRDPRAADDRRRRRARAGGAAAVRPLVCAVPRRAAVRAGQARSRPPGRRRRAGQHRRVVRRRAIGPDASGPRRRGAAPRAAGLDDPGAGPSRRGRALRAASRRGGRERLRAVVRGGECHGGGR